MTSTQILLMTAELFGGLAFFLYGMTMLSGGLENLTGGTLEQTLKRVTRNPFLSFFLGAGITIAIQSSSAMTVMLVGLVNSGIVDFCDTFGVVMGSNVGTTLTAWLLSLAGIGGDNFFLTLFKAYDLCAYSCFCGNTFKNDFQRGKEKEYRAYIYRLCHSYDGNGFYEQFNEFRSGNEGLSEFAYSLQKPHDCALDIYCFYRYNTVLRSNNRYCSGAGAYGRHNLRNGDTACAWR